MWRKVLIIGQSGAGKSTLLNVLYNSDASLESLDRPAPVGNRALGVTSEMVNYFMHDGTVLTDTVGFDDSRYDPHALVDEMRRLLRVASCTHIILVLPRGRITASTRIYLMMLQKIYGTDVFANLLLYVSRCDDGTTVDRFLQDNKKDPDLVPLCLALPDSKIVTGTLMSHLKAERDRALLPDRIETLDKVQAFTNIGLGTLRPPPGDTLEIILDFLEEVRRTIFKVKNSLIPMIKLTSNAISIRNYFPECPRCSRSDYTESNAAIQLACGHIFHFDCCGEPACIDTARFCAIKGFYLCSTCNRQSPIHEELPLVSVIQRPARTFTSAQLSLRSAESSAVADLQGPNSQAQAGCISKFRLPPRRDTFGQAVMTLYHLTAFGEEIKESGEMLRGTKGLVGGGIYFADTVETCKAKAESVGYIVEAKVLVGRALKVEVGTLKLLFVLMNQYTFARMQAEGYDSLHVVGLSTGDEFIVYNKDQVELISVEHARDSSSSSSSSS